MHAKERVGQLGVEFDENLVGHVGVCSHVAHAATEYDVALGGDVGSFDNGVVKFAVETVAAFLSHFRKMTVEVVDIVSVDTFAQVRKILIGRTHVDSVGTSQNAVEVVGGRCAGEDVDLEGTTFGMFSLCLTCDFF